MRRYRSLVGRSVAVALMLVALLPVVGSAGMDPSNLGLPPVDNVYGLSGPVSQNGASAMCVACHTVVPVVGKGSHFVHQYTGGATRNTNNQAATERLNPWSDSGARSKYGNFGLPVTSVTGVNGELICESCHNLSTNVPGGNNLVESSFPSDARPTQPSTLTGTTTTLCEGCHVAASLPGHHPMTGDATSDGSILSTAGTPFTRPYTDNNDIPSGSSSEVIYPAADSVNCLSCHGNGHSGWNGTGARILRRGWAGATSVAPAAPGAAVAGTAASGGERQFDKDPTGTNRLITNWQPLCDACHRVND